MILDANSPDIKQEMITMMTDMRNQMDSVHFYYDVYNDYEDDYGCIGYTFITLDFPFLSSGQNNAKLYQEWFLSHYITGIFSEQLKKKSL